MTNNCGMLIIRSTSRMRRKSVLAPTNPAVPPTRIAVAITMAVAVTPIASEMRPPQRSRLSRSRPRPSVPSQKRLLGASGSPRALSPSRRNCWVGSYGAIAGASNASRARRIRTIAAASGTRWRRKRRHTSPHQETGGRSRAPDPASEGRVGAWSLTA